jgi:hypothetical protein
VKWRIVEDGTFSIGRLVMGGDKLIYLSNPISQTIVSLYHISPISVKPLYQGLGIIHPKPWFVNRLVIYFWMKIAKYPGKIPISS